jgi:hypothetical protein
MGEEDPVTVEARNRTTDTELGASKRNAHRSRGVHERVTPDLASLRETAVILTVEHDGLRGENGEM